MFRAFVLALCAAVAVGGLIALSRGTQFGWVLLIEGCVAALAVALELDRYRKRTSFDSSWEMTKERFVDPDSGRLVEVWYRPSTGERAYRPVANRTDDARASSAGRTVP